MSDLIDREPLLKKWGNGCGCEDDCHGDCSECAFPGAVDDVKTAPTIPAPRWHGVEEPPPKPGCYLTASPFFHGDDYSWLYRLARWTEHGLMDFVQDAEKESGWYIWNNSQDRDTEIEPMYWMPIEPPGEDT